ncbi:HK97-gp10 family putative phage morphogenesis protein [Pseudomonas tussilaginis]|uniref:HK97-gp10 family putative phage morphogenesis protein n=1 Tax=Pseudomonas putida TaxID=303 RepID=UPI002363F98C|nr:HK97-gp10 family putative phage morphogenesis protein [Pseudomonas putida]MDD1979004.1 HK97 gp10 family phage protein [Pseudomonas putida]
MVNVSLEIVGLGDLQADLNQLAHSLANKVVRDAVVAGARVARDKARSNAPVRSGKLKKSLEAVRVKQGESPGAAAAGVRVRRGRKGKGDQDPTEAPFYWKFLEHGTSKMRAHPFIRPAWDGSLPEIERAVQEKLAEGIDKAITR